MRVRRAAALLGTLLLVAACDSGRAGDVAAPTIADVTTTALATTAPPTTILTTSTAPPTTAAPTTTTTMTTTTTTAPTTTAPPRPPRALLVGDSTLLGVETYGAVGALQGFEPVLKVASCRTLGIPSCGDPPLPPNAVETIAAAEGPFDGVVIMAGYDEWWNTFPASFDEVVRVSRDQGARWILWLTYPEGVEYLLPNGVAANEAFTNNNITLAERTALPEFSDVVLAQWGGYIRLAPDTWMHPDGIHLTPVGAYAVADYISRHIAHLSGAPCPQPYLPGSPIDPVCPNPDTVGHVADVEALYP